MANKRLPANSTMTILGISAFYHDSAAAIIQDGRIIAAAQEERFTRIKHDESFPIMNMVGSKRICGKCNFRFLPEIIGYKEVDKNT